jgi:site-specific DNA recombinase
LVKTAYNDGGMSGATMERPALQYLLADIGQGLIDAAHLRTSPRWSKIFDAHPVSFVAVTQQFNTTTSMGRLTLNVLWSITLVSPTTIFVRMEF